jgi:hypothetical protein
MRTRWVTLPCLILISGLLLAAANKDCLFLKDPEQFTSDVEKSLKMRSDLTTKVSRYVYRATLSDEPTVFSVNAASIPRKNFIDDSIFARMATANIQSAPLASDIEFLRRVTLDLTGRIPSGADVIRFVNDPNPSKRDLKVDSLIGSPEFVDKWTMFLGDLYKNNASNNNVNRTVNGRDTFYLFLKDAVSTNKPYDQLARELISASGDSFAQGQVNWPVGNTITMGPVQDTYDGHAVNLASMFLGINIADCLLCHDGARHLDQVNLFGSKLKRANMWGLSAYFARTRMQRQVVTTTPQVAKFIVSETATGEYQLNTTDGNRVARQPLNGVSVIAPSYPFATGTAAPAGIQPGESRRQALARQVTGDIQFSRAIVNYVWEKFMVQAFVSPANTFDLARLDPNNPPPAPWTLQPTNPELLQTLAEWFQANHYDLRALMALIAKSNAYQLSSTYPGTWNISYVPYYARRYVRRLDAEELHDAIAKATGIPGNYTLQGSALPPVQWAMQFPDTTEGGSVAGFLNAFGRGDRDTMSRRSDGSILQSLDMLNSPVVLGRIHQNNPGSRVAILMSQTSDPQTIISDLFLNTLSRAPTDQEVAFFMPVFQQLGNRTAAENLQWVLLNKVDFLFNY